MRACVLRLCWLFSWWACNCRYFNGYIHIRHLLALFPWAVGKLEKKDPSDCCGLPTAAQISPPHPPPHRYVRARVYKLRRLFWVENSEPPTPCRDQWPLMVPLPPTPGCEEPAGVLKFRTGNLKIDTVGVIFRKIPAIPPCSTCYSPSPPPDVVGGGDEARGVQPFPS